MWWEGISSRGPTETVVTPLYPPLFVSGPGRVGRERLRQKISMSGEDTSCSKIKRLKKQNHENSPCEGCVMLVFEIYCVKRITLINLFTALFLMKLRSKSNVRPMERTVLHCREFKQLI